ncbi:hypothetical protein A2U01_0080034 [Trifolium medium]|uniref:Uncharacterized protein n=1 Tax=Trifolium medium TaxID=97028 RepID=A0A392TCE3_9FABA|nr:hypothetical protein [Trifolium medium]
MKQQELIVPDRALRQAPCAPRRSQKLTSKTFSRRRLAPWPPRLAPTTAATPIFCFSSISKGKSQQLFIPATRGRLMQGTGPTT